MNDKPLGRKAYGSIGHLPNSRLGPTDSCVTSGMARICTEKARDKHDRIIVQEKLDGSCCAVACVGGEIVALGRAGYLAKSSPHEMHHMFAAWVQEREWMFLDILCEGERLVGEWLAQAHGTMYSINNADELFAPFDLMVVTSRATCDELTDRLNGSTLTAPAVIGSGPLSVEDAVSAHESNQSRQSDGIEGVVYRVERMGKVDFLAKWVRADKVDGKYLPSQTGGEPVWNFNL